MTKLIRLWYLCAWVASLALCAWIVLCFVGCKKQELIEPETVFPQSYVWKRRLDGFNHSSVEYEFVTNTYHHPGDLSPIETNTNRTEPLLPRDWNADEFRMTHTAHDAIEVKSALNSAVFTNDGTGMVAHEYLYANYYGDVLFHWTTNTITLINSNGTTAFEFELKDGEWSRK